MFDDRFEYEIKKHAESIFGQGSELPEGHRERFEQRLKERRNSLTDNNERSKPEIVPDTGIVKQKKGIIVQFEKWFAGAAAVAAVIIGFMFLTDTMTEEQTGPRVDDVRNYYSMQLEEQVEATKLLVSKVDEEDYREFLSSNIEQIKNTAVPDVQVTDEEYIVLIASVYTDKIEALRNMQNILKEQY